MDEGDSFNIYFNITSPFGFHAFCRSVEPTRFGLSETKWLELETQLDRDLKEANPKTKCSFVSKCLCFSEVFLKLFFSTSSVFGSRMIGHTGSPPARPLPPREATTRRRRPRGVPHGRRSEFPPRLVGFAKVSSFFVFFSSFKPSKKLSKLLI